MRKLSVMDKKAAERNLEARDMLHKLLQQVEEALKNVDYLRNNFDDVLDVNKIRDLFDAKKKLEEVKKKI